MVDFVSSLIFQLFGVFFPPVFCTEQHYCSFRIIFGMFLDKKFQHKLHILHGLWTLQNGRFSKWSHFSNIWCFFQWFFAQNSSTVLVESFLACCCKKKLPHKLPILHGLSTLVNGPFSKKSWPNLDLFLGNLDLLVGKNSNPNCQFAWAIEF